MSDLTPEKGELVGALMGDKGTFKIQQRHGFYHGYDLSKYTRCTMSICLGRDKEWGTRLANLMMISYGVHGSRISTGVNGVSGALLPKLFETCLSTTIQIGTAIVGG